MGEAARHDTFEMLFGLRRESFFYKGRKRILTRLLRDRARALASRPSPPLIADIGSGHGSLLLADTVRESGIAASRIVGVDIDLPTLKRIRTMAGADTALVNADILRLPFRGTFDIVFLLDVLEHVDDDAGLLQELGRICAVGGLLVLTVPAMSRTYGVFDKVAGHKRRYDRRDLREKLVNAGFVIHKLSYYIFFLAPLIRLMKAVREAWCAIRGKEAGLADVVENRVVPVANGLCLMTLMLESALIPRIDLPFGSAIVAIAVKGASR